MGTLRRRPSCGKLRELIDMLFGVVNGVGRGMGILMGGPREKGRFRGFSFP